MRVVRRIVALILITIVVFSSTSNCAYAKGVNWNVLKEKSDSVVNDAKEKADDVKNAASEAADSAKKVTTEATNNAKKTVSETAESAKKAANEAADSTKKATTEATNNAKKAASETAESAKKTAAEAADTAKNGITDAYNSSVNYICSVVTQIDTKKFENGWSAASKYAVSTIAAQKGSTYVKSVQTAITNAQTSIYNVTQNERTVASKAGFIAEEWHTGTFNVDSVASGSEYSAKRPDSNTKASADIVIEKNGKEVQKIGSKYYKDGTSSAKAQSKTIMQNYSEYLAKAEKDGKQPMSFNDYLDANVQLKDAYQILDSEYASEYAGQTRLIPADQMDEAAEYLRKKIGNEAGKEGPNRQKLAKSYQDTLDSLADRINAPDGTESKPLSENEAKAIADLCDNEDFNIEDFGVTTSQAIKPKYILKQSMMAGTQAAALEVALTIGPELYTVIAEGIKNGDIDENELKEIGVDAAFAGANGFVEGAVSAAIITSCQAGKFGAQATNLSPEAIGILTVLTIDAIKYGYKLSNGEITVDQYGDLLAEEIFVALVSNASGAALQALLPCVPFAYLAGSMIGGMVASAAYETGKEVILQVSAGNGFEAIIPITVSNAVNIGQETVSKIDVKKIGNDLKKNTISTTSNGLIKLKSITG